MCFSFKASGGRGMSSIHNIVNMPPQRGVEVEWGES